jgi:hypothetical protein
MQYVEQLTFSVNDVEQLTFHVNNVAPFILGCLSMT